MELIPINDKIELERVRRLKVGLVEEPAHLNLDWLAKENWSVVPVESSSHFVQSAATHLSRAFSAICCEQVFALATEDLTEVSAAGEEIGFLRPDFVVQTSEGSLLEFSAVCGPFNFILVPSSRAAGVLCTVYDYYLVAGPADFVRLGVGGDIETAWRSFEQCASDPVWEGRLLKIAKRYRETSRLITN